MMISEHNHYYHHNNPTIHIPPWNFPEDQTVDMLYPYPYSHSPDIYSDFDTENENSDYVLDVYSSDLFRMYEFKVRRCTLEQSHDWTDCPYAHPGEKACRRDPRKYVYSGGLCPEYRKGNCNKGDGCEFGHGVFECWLHPTRYRTQVCKDGLNCTRRVCFFAHTVDQLRVGSVLSSTKSAESFDGSLFRKAVSSPVTSPVSDLVTTLRQLQLSQVNSFSSSWVRSPVFGSPMGKILRPVLRSLPNTPTPIQPHQEIGYLGNGEFEEPIMERVESGRDLRAKMFEKLRNENNLDRVDPNPSSDSGPDVRWVSDLVM